MGSHGGLYDLPTPGIRFPVLLAEPAGPLAALTDAFMHARYGGKLTWVIIVAGFFWLGILLVILGVQFMFFGLIAEMMTRIYHESTDRSTYVIREIIRSQPTNKRSN